MSTTGQGADQPVDPDLEQEEHGFLEDEVIVPKGTSRRTFLLTLALTLFVLVIFTVGDLFQSVVGGGGGADEVHLSWQDPDSGESHEVLGSEFMVTKRKLDRLWRAGIYQPLNAAEGRKAKIKDEDVVLFTVLDNLAKREGVDVSKDEFVRALREGQWTGDLIRQNARINNMNARDFEAELREGMRPTKLRMMLLGAASMAADPNQVVSEWQEENPQYTFEYVALDAEAMEAAAIEATPDDEALEAWYGELPTWDQQKYFTDEKVRATVAYVPMDGSFDATLLMEAYPLPEDWDEDAQARSYYNRTTAVRFKNPEAAKEEESEGEETEGEEDAEDPPPLYLEFEAVAERAAEEARINQGLTAFLASLRERDTDEWGEATKADLATEAAALGLTVWTGDEAIPKPEFEEMEGWGGRQIANMLGFGVVDAFMPRVVAEENALIVGRVEEKTEREAAPFADIRDQIAERWAADNAIELAVERLEALRDQFGERPAEEEESDEESPAEDPLAVDEEEDAPWAPETTSEAFAAAVAALSSELGLETPLEVVTRGPLGRREYPDDDLPGASAADRYIVATPALYELEPGQVIEVAADGTRQTAVLVRFVEETEPSPDSMKAQELLSARSRLAGEAYRDFDSKVMNPSSDWFKERYKVNLRSWNQESEEETETEPDA